MEIIGIKKLNDRKLFLGTSLHPVNWTALISTTVNTLNRPLVKTPMAPTIVSVTMAMLEMVTTVPTLTNVD